MTVTIYTDASHDPLTNRASYAFRIFSPAANVSEAHVFRDVCEGSTEAELKAIANGLHAVVGLDLSEIDKIVLYTDCMPAMHLIHGGAKNKFAGARIAAANIHELIAVLMRKFPISGITWRHVKAHTDDGNPNGKHNAWCDQQARKALKLYKK